MRTIPIFPLAAGLFALPCSPLFAIEAPEDDAPPPLEAARPDNGEPAQDKPADAAEARKESAYMGVVSADVPAMLADHLGLQEDEGVVVRALAPESPAAKAGLAVHDVITRVDGQAVGSSEALAKQVAGHQPGDKVRLDLVHKGKATVIEVTLAKRPADLAEAGPWPLDELQLDGIPKDMADRLKGMIEGNLGELQIDPEALGENPPQAEDAMRDIRKRMEKAMEGLKLQPLPQGGGIRLHQGATFRLMDDQGSIELKSSDGGKEITVRDKENKITWSGPWDTEQDKAAAPEEIRKRVERLNIGMEGNGFKLEFRQQPEAGEGE
jgi:hypothetical protein